MCLLFYLLLIATCFEACKSELCSLEYSTLFIFHHRLIYFFFFLDALYTRHLFHKTYKLYIVSLLAGKFFFSFAELLACFAALFCLPMLIINHLSFFLFSLSPNGH